MRTKHFLLFAYCAIPISAPAQEGVQLMDNQTFVHLRANELEIVDVTDEKDLSWDADLWFGGDFQKLWMKTRGERSDRNDDRTEIQLLYSKSVLPFWDLQAGIRRAENPALARNWAVIALRGLAPYFFDVEAELFLADGGQSSFRFTGEYEVLLTQRLILTPELELTGYGRNEPRQIIGSGLSKIEFDLRLRYEIRRELAPYVGISWRNLYGNSKDFADSAGFDSQDVSINFGLRAWF